MRPTVSVITTSYNQRDLLPRAIRSVQAQRGVLLEHVVVDDGSADGSADVARGMLRVQDTLVSGTHRGLMGAYQTAFGLCRGEFVALCDADDWWVDVDKLVKQVDYLRAHPSVAVCFTPVWVDDGRGPVRRTEYAGPLTYDVLLRGGCPMMSPGVMIRADAMMPYIHAMWDEVFFTWDYPIYLYAARYWALGHIPDVTAVYTRHTESFSNTRSRRRRLRYVLGVACIKAHFVWHHGCRLRTMAWAIYRFVRDLYSVIFRRWYA